MIQVQEADFCVQSLYEKLKVKNRSGAIAIFVGLVREFQGQNSSDSIDDDHCFQLEHYPGMTEHNLKEIIDDANSRWPLLEVCVVHRFGKLALNDQIVFVGVSAAHRAEAFLACDFIMDYLKSRAAFWKKETTSTGSHWVEAKESDSFSLKRWRES
ncbi:molybdenum cofactor biosynthesis protein MoaE [Marinomonas sp. 15G1-11]|uniref:Molybdopterin synthase catalytic subunit n=1 Tax=Marinomonas phaeophyticola TaxID=3004091 RepID=A0ABT4JPS7_9GAMM|nr:molybdenum cofactor biosynthesis protein MoaE [Marinomonas sp. 15G1-11]